MGWEGVGAGPHRRRGGADQARRWHGRGGQAVGVGMGVASVVGARRRTDATRELEEKAAGGHGGGRAPPGGACAWRRTGTAVGPGGGGGHH
jgi:hypothetical protein